MIRRIVIPVRGDGKGDNVFAHAAAIARRHDAHVVVTHCRARAEDMMPYGVPIPAAMRKLLLDQSATVADQVEEGLRAETESLAARFGLTMSETPLAGTPSASWVEEQGRQVDVIKRHGRLADLICVAKPDVSRNLGANTLKAALFNTGRPVMMCPEAESAPEALGARAEDLRAYLADRGIEARVERFEAKRRIGDELLEQARGAGADTLLMGAYSDSHERETVFGGNTQQVVDRSTLPVVMVH